MRALLYFFAVACFSPSVLRAEWRTEEFSLVGGWNAVYLHVDGGHTDLAGLTQAYPQIEQVWRWQVSQLDRVLRDPQSSDGAGLTGWAVWDRAAMENTTFTRMYGNYGYLVKVTDGAAPFTWEVKGRPVIPKLRWRNDGLNLLGFAVDSQDAPTFGSFLEGPDFEGQLFDILSYRGGEISDGVNPRLISNASRTSIERGQAYWINNRQYSEFTGPLVVKPTISGGLDFGTVSSSLDLTLENVSDEEVDYTVAVLTSEDPPAGTSAIQGAVPLLLQVLNEEDGEVERVDFTERTVTIAAGGSLRLAFEVNRSAMSGVEGARFASLLKVSSNSAAGMEVYVPVSAEIQPTGGLWVGEARITEVGSVRKTFVRNSDGETERTAEGDAVVETDHSTLENAGELPKTAQAFPLRILCHRDATGEVTFLSRIYSGRLTAGGVGLAVNQSLLDPEYLKDARRISVPHLPLNVDERIGSDFGPGATIPEFTITTAYDDKENPFVHRFHPDHDNLDPQFGQKLGEGKESFDVSRRIQMVFDVEPPADAPANWGTEVLTGVYRESIDGVHRNTLRTRGRFTLRKVSQLDVLNR